MSKCISIIGGCGHVGLPLGLAFAHKGNKVRLVDINKEAVEMINKGEIPFIEEGAIEILRQVNKNKLMASTDPEIIKNSDVVIFTTGTPIDEHHNPRIHDVVRVFQQYLPFLAPKHLIVLRSTVYPGTTELINNILIEKWGHSLLSFCPERIVQGKGIQEIYNLPQIISAMNKDALQMAEELFLMIAPKVIHLEAMEAEVSKLIINAWRYIEFAAANQFYILLEQKGLNFFKIFDAIKQDYPRAQHFPKPGLAAGPCLFKDTMQLAAFHDNNFSLGQAAMLVNEGLPNFIVTQLEKKMGSLKNKKICILGMTFKANNDDIRESLSFKIKKILEYKYAQIIPSDPHLKETMDYKKAIEIAEGVILGVPHKEFLNLKINKPYIDCWGIWKRSE